MPRIRYLKPEFFSDEDLCSLPYQARILFAGMWCYADKAGRLEDRPKFLKAMIFPYDNVDIEKLLHSLTEPKSFIIRYQSESRSLIQIINWEKHQKPHHTEKDSTFPPAPPLMEKGMGMEKGMEKQLNPSTELKNGEITVKEPLKDKYGEFKNISLSNEEIEKLKEKHGENETLRKIESFSNSLRSQPKKYSKYKDHYATLNNWLSMDQERASPNKQGLREKNLAAAREWLEGSKDDSGK